MRRTPNEPMNSGEPTLVDRIAKQQVRGGKRLTRRRLRV